MKVILAGLPKTGTKSLAYALKILGYDVYGCMEHFWYHNKEWNKTLTNGTTVHDFKQMYQDVNVVTDTPIYTFWEDILKAFPDALIILTLRDEESWIKSWEKQIEMINSDLKIKLLWILTPMDTTIFGFTTPYAWFKVPVHYQTMLSAYRIHNENVLKRAPTQKLHLFDVRDGWGPLCSFLQQTIPDIPFPHENAEESVVDDFLRENEIMKKLRLDTIFAGTIWLTLGSATLFFVGRSLVMKYNIDALAKSAVFRSVREPRLMQDLLIHIIIALQRATGM